MRSTWHSLRKSPTERRRLTLALATVEERLVDAHAEAAKAFLQTTGDELSYQRALDIFFRVVDVPDRLREPVTLQTLAHLAETAASSAPADDLNAGISGALRRTLLRLRGRRAGALRRRVDRAAQRARKTVERTYLEGASVVVRELADTVAPAEAVQAYIEALDIGADWGERVFHQAVAAADAGSGRDRPDSDQRVA